MSIRTLLGPRLLSVVLACVCLVASSNRVAAQQPPEYVEPDAEQLELNDQAVQAIIEDEYSRAIALLEEARLQGELNIVLLNLGRAYQKLGKCAEAREALSQVEASPAVRSPAPELVNQKAADYLAELDEQCDEESGLAEDKTETDQTQSTDQAGPSGAEAGSAEVVEPAQIASSSAEAWEWAVLGGGAVVALGGVGVHFLAENKRADVTSETSYRDDVNIEVTQREALALQDEANSLDNLALGMVIAGGVATGVGTYLVLTGGESAESSVSLQLSGEGGSVVWSGRF